MPKKPTLTKIRKTKQSPTENPHISVIDELDKSAISMVRKMWMEARDPKDKEKWRKKLDSSLDERLRLMKLRDSFTK